MLPSTLLCSSSSSSSSSSPSSDSATERQLLLNERAILRPEYDQALNNHFKDKPYIIEIIAAFRLAHNSKQAALPMSNATPTVAAFAREILYNQRKLKN